MKEIKIYTTSNCPFCNKAKKMLTELEVPFENVDLTDKPEELSALKEKTGWMTVPQIFIGEELIGGYTDMKALHEKGQLFPKIQK